MKCNKHKLTKFFLLLVAAAFTLPAMAQVERNVSGVVTDLAGDPLAGVTVLIPGTTFGTSTDATGAYILNARDAEYLEYSCLGYKTQKVKLEGQVSVNVTLLDDRTSLDEIVVVGYGTQKRRDIVGAIETLDTDEISERVGAGMGVSRALQGAIPGLTMTFNDGKPNKDANIRIRGVENSIGVGGSALVLLDGVEVSMNNVNPQDIESITVLKDASSTAVYGARGTFGVILLTSKTPQKGRTKITYEGAFNMYARTVQPSMITNGQQWATTYLEGYRLAQGVDPTGINNLFPITSDYFEELAKRDADPTLPKYRVNSSGQYEYFGNTNWYDLFYNKIWYGHQHNISASGGGDVATYYISGRFYQQDGVYRIGEEKWNQYNMMAKGTINIKPWLHISETFDFTYRKTHEPGIYFNNSTTPNAISRMLNHQFFPVAVPYTPDGNYTAQGASGYAQIKDDTAYNERRTTEIGSKTLIQLDMIKDVLWATADFGYRFNSQRRIWAVWPNTYYTSPDNAVEYPNDSQYRENFYDSQRITGDVTVNYVPRLGENNNLSIMVGWNIENYLYESTTIRRNGMIVDWPNWSLLDGEDLSVSDNGSYDWSMVGAFFRVNYNYKSKYLVEVSGRYDGSSKFPANSRWGFFPSGSIGWRISEEGWMKGADWLNNLKIRASIGSAGNGLISNAFAYLSTMSIVQSSILNNGSYFKYTSAPTPVPDGLTWETALTYNLGLDFEALDGRLNFVGDIYRKNTTNMYVVGEELPAVYGNSAPKGNYADMRTDGWELSAGWRDSYNVGGKILAYNIKGAVWDSRSYITRYTSKTGTLPTIYTQNYYEGMELGEIWGYVCNGFYESDEEAASYDLSLFKFNNATYGAGDAKFEDLNGDGAVNRGNNTIYDHGDLVKIGNKSPRYCYSLSGGISWNGIGLSFMFQGVGKRDWYPAAESGWFWGQYNRPYGMTYSWQQKDHWTEDNTNAYWPRNVGYVALNGNLKQPNTRYLQSARYLRLKNLTVDYSFSNKVCSKIGLQGLKIYVSCENPFTFTPLHKYAKNYDPEGIYPGDSDYATNNEGSDGYGDGDGYPVLKSYTIGLSITL